MTASILHVVFTPSGALDLRKAIDEAGRDDRVVALFDCLSFGPINPPDPVARAKWVEEVLGYSGYEDVFIESEAFWQAALSPENRKIAWLSRRSTLEYAGFLEWLWRLGDAPFEAVDLTDVTITGGPLYPARPYPALSLGMLQSHEILENNLLDRAEALPPERLEHYRRLWATLRTENAPLRVIEGGDLVSAPLSFFDALVLSHATHDWQKMAFVVGSALCDFLDTGLFQIGDFVLAARARALAESGALEARGDVSDIRQCEVRLK